MFYGSYSHRVVKIIQCSTNLTAIQLHDHHEEWTTGRVNKKLLNNWIACKKMWNFRGSPGGFYQENNLDYQNAGSSCTHFRVRINWEEYLLQPHPKFYSWMRIPHGFWAFLFKFQWCPQATICHPPHGWLTTPHCHTSGCRENICCIHYIFLLQEVKCYGARNVGEDWKTIIGIQTCISLEWFEWYMMCYSNWFMCCIIL